MFCLLLLQTTSYSLLAKKKHPVPREHVPVFSLSGWRQKSSLPGHPRTLRVHSRALAHSSPEQAVAVAEAPRNFPQIRPHYVGISHAAELSRARSLGNRRLHHFVERGPSKDALQIRLIVDLGQTCSQVSDGAKAVHAHAEALFRHNVLLYPSNKEVFRFQLISAGFRKSSVRAACEPY